MRYKTLITLMVLFLACRTSAQNTVSSTAIQLPYISADGFASPLDIADYSHFRQGLTWVGPVSSTDTTTTHYRQVWVEGMHGGLTMISRGDGSLTLYRADKGMDWFEVIPFRTAEGHRGLMVVHEVPCGLICRTTKYYVEE